VDEADPPVTVRQPPPAKSRDPLPPLRINIPDPDVNFSSPFPSPTGTIRYVKQNFLTPVAFLALYYFKVFVYRKFTVWN
jgi:hypothetical protein